MSLTLGLLRETHRTDDRRVPLTPAQAARVQREWGHRVLVQSSGHRAYADAEYAREGLLVVEDLSEADILLGVKEPDPAVLLKGKTYFCFSHTIKRQAHNKQLLAEAISKEITLFDYELIRDQEQHRLVAFGRWAGLIGAYLGLQAWGRRTGGLKLPPLLAEGDDRALFAQIRQVAGTPLRAVVTGGGRSASGAVEVLDALGLKRLSPEEFLKQRDIPGVYTQLRSEDLYSTDDGRPFRRSAFHLDPRGYYSRLTDYLQTSELLIHAAFWNRPAPPLLRARDLRERPGQLLVLADIACDVGGPMAPTIRTSTLEAPFYDVVPNTLVEQSPFSSSGHLTVLAVDNLPTALPRAASEAFGKMLLAHVIPHLASAADELSLRQAVILKDGKFADRWVDLAHWVGGK